MAIRSYTNSELGYAARRYRNAAGVIVLPDLDANLYWEFRDSAGVLQFTATTISTPAITAGVDAEGAFVYVDGIDLTAYAIGIVEMRAYANVAAVPVVPSPELAYPFELVADDSLVIQLRTLLHLDDDTQDVLLAQLIDSAADYASKYLARTLIYADRVKQVQAPAGRGLSHTMLKYPTILLTYPPVVSVDRVYKVDDYGNETEVTEYWLDDVSDPPELHLKSPYYYENKLRVEYSAGYGDNYGDLPEAIQRGILLHAAHLYKYRGDCPIEESAVTSGAIGAYRIYKCVRRG